MLGSTLGAAAVATVLSLVLAPGRSRQALRRHRPGPRATRSRGSRCTPSGARSPARAACSGAAAAPTPTATRSSLPEGIWSLEVFISGPGLKHLAAGAFLDGYDPMAGTGHYTLCRVTTSYGKFTIEAKLSTDNGSGHITEGRLPDDHLPPAPAPPPLSRRHCRRRRRLAPAVTRVRHPLTEVASFRGVGRLAPRVASAAIRQIGRRFVDGQLHACGAGQASLPGCAGRWPPRGSEWLGQPTRSGRARTSAPSTR